MAEQETGDPRGKILAVIADGKPIVWFRCPGCGQSGGIDGEQALGRVSIECPSACGFHKIGVVEPVIFMTEPLRAMQQFTVS